MPGRHCVVKGCTNGTYGIKKWQALYCEIHDCKKGMGRCVCPEPYTLYTFPTQRANPEARKEWIKLVSKYINNKCLICYCFNKITQVQYPNIICLGPVLVYLIMGPGKRVPRKDLVSIYWLVYIGLAI